MRERSAARKASSGAVRGTSACSQPLPFGLQERACGAEQTHGALEVVLPHGDRGERLQVVGDAWFVPGLGRLRHPLLQMFRRAGQIAPCLAAERHVVGRDEDGEPVLLRAAFRASVNSCAARW
jgi:hypothetical protein